MTTPVTELTALKIQTPITKGQGGLQVAQMTEPERDQMITLNAGTIIYNTSANQFEFYQNGNWVSLAKAAVSDFEAGTFAAGNANKIIKINAAGTKAIAAALVAEDLPASATNRTTIHNLMKKKNGK